jgi:hypothetical protein
MALSTVTLWIYDHLRGGNSTVWGLAMRNATQFALLVTILAFATPVQAATQSISAWVSGTGNDGNQNSGCPRTAPCQTLTSALIAVFPGGTISCADPTFTPPGPLTISKSVTIDCSGSISFGDGVSPDGGNGINISTAGVEVTLRGLDIQGVALNSTPPVGVNITAAAIVRLENCKISGFGNAGIKVAPSAGNVTVKIQDSTISANGSGVLVAPTGSGSASMSIERSRIENNGGGGVKTDTTSGAINTSISDSSVSFNTGNGVNVVSGSGAQNMLSLTRDIIALNGTAGVQTNGGTSAALIDTTLLDSNTTGATEAVAGGILLTYGNNRIIGLQGSGFTGSSPLE